MGAATGGWWSSAQASDSPGDVLRAYLVRGMPPGFPRIGWLSANELAEVVTGAWSRWNPSFEWKSVRAPGQELERVVGTRQLAGAD
jgi:hypothetical protein